MKKFASFCRSVCRKAKGYVLALGVALGFCASSAHAEGAGSGDIDISLASDLATKLNTAITTFWTDNKTVLITILSIGVGIALALLVYKIFKRGTSRA